jgi:hypothetical protein
MKKFDKPIRDAGTDDNLLLTFTTKVTFTRILEILYAVISVRKVCKRLNLNFYVTLKLAYTEEQKGFYLILNVNKETNVPIRKVHSFLRFFIPLEIRSQVITWGRAYL